MTEKNGHLQNGQALAQVAILMVVLLAFAALAIDGGRIYLERRRMQNAADAGALAGAREICFGDGSQDPLVVAEQYAVNQNGRHGGVVMPMPGMSRSKWSPEAGRRSANIGFCDLTVGHCHR
jgi:uncharacterized membrane protein